jgi:xanthine dehydrogenase accessory factor
MQQEVLQAVTQALGRGEAVALVTIIRTQGSTPQRVGAKMAVFADGRTVGTIGGGCYEHDAFWKAREALNTRRPQVFRYELSDDLAEESGLICGGQMEVYVEPLEPAPRLYLIGAGHVAQQLAHVAHRAGFRLHVIDDREKFANPERFPDANEIVVDDIPDWLRQADLPSLAYVVILTRGHRHDLDALRSLVSRDFRYLGLIGSRAKAARLFDVLHAEGIPVERLHQVHVPVGLDIGAVTPEEIAISIAAELIAVRHGKLTPGEATDVARAGDLSMRWAPRWHPKAVT